jgi:hypothetical protein
VFPTPASAILTAAENAAIAVFTRVHGSILALGSSAWARVIRFAASSGWPSAS